MKHPLVISLLDYKWKRFGRYIFFGNLFIYLTFLVFLTAFALVVQSPVERPCKHILYKIFMHVCMGVVPARIVSMLFYRKRALRVKLMNIQYSNYVKYEILTKLGLLQF